MIGRILAHYRIVAPCGSGGMGTVYRAEDLRLGRSVALKFPHPDLAREPAARARFLTEARAASTLDHPNIVVLFDVCEEGAEIYLVMQYIEGISLRDRLRAGRIPISEILAIGRGAADGLAHAHDRGVIHRDVKPGNILVCPDGRVKILDFGVARLLADEEATRTAVAVGTPRYLAPEVTQGAIADARSDLYSLGVVLYELCTGEPPWRTPLDPALPEGLRHLIANLLETDPGARPRSAIEVSDALWAVAVGAGAGPHRGVPAPGPPAEAVHAAPMRSIAVLPFENLTGSHDEDYFCSGIAEDILTEVQRIPDLKVASRSLVDSVHQERIDPREAAKSLGVAAVIEGGVRRAGGRVRVTARLIRAEDGFQVWGDRYDRSLEDIFEVQAEIAARIADALRVTLRPESEDVRALRRTRSPKAYDLRLRALAHSNRIEERDMREAIALLEEALREDPLYALGHADLAECCVQMVCKGWDLDRSWLNRAEREALRAQEIAPKLADGYRAMGHLWNHRGNLERALREFHFAVELDPRLAYAHGQLGSTYLFLGDLSRADIYTRRAQDLEPGNPRVLTMRADVLRRQGRHGECIEVLHAALATNPPDMVVLGIYEVLLACRAEAGDRAELRREAEDLHGRVGEADADARALLAFAAAAGGETREAERLLAPGFEGARRIHPSYLAIARARSILGDLAGSTEALERALAVGHLDAHGLRTDRWLRVPDEIRRRYGLDSDQAHV